MQQEEGEQQQGQREHNKFLELPTISSNIRLAFSAMFIKCVLTYTNTYIDIIYIYSYCIECLIYVYNEHLRCYLMSHKYIDTHMCA